jgi:hypothetical protein
VLVSGWDCRYVSGFIIVCADVRLVVVDMTQIFTQITLLTCGYTFWSAPKGRREADRHNLSDNFVTSTIFPFPPSTPFFPPTFVLTLYNMFHFFFIFIFFLLFFKSFIYIFYFCIPPSTPCFPPINSFIFCFSYRGHLYESLINLNIHDYTGENLKVMLKPLIVINH